MSLHLGCSISCRYQTGAITPLLRWLQRAGGAAARPPQAPARPENRAPLAAQNDGNVQPPGRYLKLHFNIVLYPTASLQPPDSPFDHVDIVKKISTAAKSLIEVYTVSLKHF